VAQEAQLTTEPSEHQPSEELSMPVLKANLVACQGYANCVAAAPDVYDIDDEGKVVLLEIEISEKDRARIEEAAQSCPASALTVEDR
jgi:ferredoxin